MPVLFDLDGTLLDTAPDFAFVLNTLRAKISLPPLPFDLIRPYVSEGVLALIRLSFGYEESHPECLKLRDEFLKLYSENICQFTEPFPGMLSLLSLLEEQNIPWGVVTNKPAYLTENLLSQLALKHRAACIVSGDTTPHLKPHPASLLHASTCLGVLPKQCVYIGDAIRDIQAGNAAGMVTIAALFGYINKNEDVSQWKASFYAKTVDDLHDHIENILSIGLKKTV